MPLFHETSDVSVRPALAGDADAITEVQVRAWRTSHGEVLGADVLDLLDLAEMSARWTGAIDHAPSPAHRVLVALDGPRLVGLATSVPAPGGGVEVAALEVDPEARRGGHGSRLLAACVDLAREDGAQWLVTWVLEGDDAREQFLAGAGLGPDGAERTLASGPDRDVVERRWGASI
jgi:GNAT superfamily N-acetyltransferase